MDHDEPTLCTFVPRTDGGFDCVIDGYSECVMYPDKINMPEADAYTYDFAHRGE